MSAASCSGASSTSGGRTRRHSPSLPKCATTDFSAAIIGYFCMILRVALMPDCSLSASPERQSRNTWSIGPGFTLAVALIQAVAPQMRKRKSGRIVNVGSVAAFTGHPDLWYGATKAALLNVTKSYASHLGRDGILVNAVAPGPTLTAMYEQLPQSRKDGVMRSVHSGRACTPEEVAQAILWLGTSSPAYMSGSTVDVNSGSYPR